MTIRTTFKWTSADLVGEGRAEVDEAYLPGVMFHAYLAMRDAAASV